MTKTKLEFFNEDQIETLKEMFENEWEIIHPAEILANIIGYVPNMSATFLSDIDEEKNEDIDLIAITYSEYTDQALGMVEAEYKKVIERFVAELKKVFKEISGKTLTMIEQDDMVNVNRSHWKTAMRTEMFHLEIVYTYDFPEKENNFGDKNDPADKLEFKYDRKMNSKYEDNFDEDIGYEDLELIT
jgi:hypothetical protein